MRESLKKTERFTHIGVGKAEIKQVASNRRVLGPDGKVRFTRTSATKDPIARAEPGRPVAGVEWPAPGPAGPDRLRPAHRQNTRTISGIVSSVRDATSNGVEAHVLSLKEASGATYLLFTWGRPTVRPGDAVEIDALFAAAAPGADPAVYQGVVTEVRRAK